jgi:hypothetical protein
MILWYLEKPSKIHPKVYFTNFLSASLIKLTIKINHHNYGDQEVAIGREG